MMQTIRSRFLTVICGVSLTLTLIFGSLCVFLVDRSETEIAAKTLNGRAVHASATLNPIFMQSEDIVHYIGHTIEHEIKDPKDLRDEANRDRLEAMIRRSFYNAATGIDGVQGYYLHYNEYLAGGPDGFWYTRKDAHHDFAPPSRRTGKTTRTGRTGIICPYVRRRPCGRRLTSITIMASA